MNFYFDYVFYRVSKLYHKYDKGDGVYGCIYIVMTEGILLMDFFIFLERFFFTTQQLQDSKIGLITATVSILPLGAFNYLKYVRQKGKYQLFENRWKDEAKAKKITKGFLVFISLTIPWLLLFLLNALYHCSQCGLRN